VAPRREDIGSWLEGGPRDPSGGPARPLLPPTGPGSSAPVGRRVLALLIDWGLASVIGYAFFDYHPLAVLGVFAASTALLVSMLGHTIGHRLLGIQVVRVQDVERALRLARDARRRASEDREVEVPWLLPGFLLGVTRTVLLCLVVPAVVWDSSGRGLHDVAVGTAIVRR
jgi:hypothetical protein